MSNPLIKNEGPIGQVSISSLEYLIKKQAELNLRIDDVDG